MPHPKQHITDLAAICKKRNIKHIVISPGSRSAPLIKAFYELFGDNCISIVDERSAAYFALGISAHQRTPAVIICTSGTAVLNYAPAIAEAYYQEIPLLVVTADRPREWIDQQDNQTLHQNGIYNGYIRSSFELPQYIATDEDLWYTHRCVNDAINICTGNVNGPVHINVPLTEPLYDTLPSPSDVKIIQASSAALQVKLPDELINAWNRAAKIMIIHGQDFPGSETIKYIKALAADPRVVVIAENISNIPDPAVIQNSNLILSVSRGKSPEYPDLILHSGGQVVSKALTGYLRRAGKTACWRIGPGDKVIDTFKLANGFIPYPAAVVYKMLKKSVSRDAESYSLAWHKRRDEALKKALKRFSEMTFTDSLVFKNILMSISDGANVILGNSSVIRYSQLLPVNPKAQYYSNRGVSGIDGSISTAAGIAYASKNLTIAIVGDLGFLYDSNGLWNRELPANLRIVVVNNLGGGIFHIIKGPSEHPGFKKFIEANHPVNIAKLAEAYGLKYLFAADEKTLAVQWQSLTGRQKTATILEIRTDAVASAAAFRNLMLPS